MMPYKTIKRIETKDFTIELMVSEQYLYRVKLESPRFDSFTIPVQNLSAAMAAFDVLYNSALLNN